ncbi:MAG TPA: ABC transporter permease [Kofleriaceae bacterium]|nr:ABC transporter permease [Kofleriaceae bacterium]
MREALVIAKRELLERVRTKWFVAITVLGPVLMVGLIVVPALLVGRGSAGAKVAIIDQTGKVADALAAALAADDQHWKVTVEPRDTTDEAMRAQLRSKQLNGFIRIPADGLGAGHIIYSGDNATNQAVAITLQRSITAAVLQARGVPLDKLSPPTIDKLLSNGETQGQSGEGTFLLGYIIAFILYMVITLYGINVMRSVVTEKSSRVVELLVAATKPRAMMVGKILGVGGAGLAQISLWFIVGGVALAFRSEILGWLGAGNTGSMLPSLSFAQIMVIVAFFVLGYLFYSTLFAALGATVSSEQDSQQAAMPITMLLVIGMVSMTAITGDPRGSTSAAMTQIPFWSPMLMPLRFLLGGASPTEVGLSLAILAGSTVLIARAAAKIYRVGILMYGKRPGFAELLRWLRY